MKELEVAIVAAFTKMAETGAIQTIIEREIERTVGDILHSSLQPYSDFGKSLGKTIKSALNVDLDRLGIAGYNDTILKIVKTKLDSSMELFGKAQIEKDLEELLKVPPKEIKLSQLVEQLKDHYGDHGRECTCIITHDMRMDGWGRVYLHKNDRVEKSDCEYEMAFTADGEVYSVSIDGRDPSKKIFCGPFYGFERDLFQMYAAKTRLIIDEDDVDIYYKGCD